MRKLTKNELIELRACKQMDNGQQEFFTRAKRMYANEEDALARITEVEDMFHEIDAMDESTEGDAKAYEAYDQAQLLYYQKVDELLKEIGYTPKPKRVPNDIFDVLEDMFGKPDEE